MARFGSLGSDVVELDSLGIDSLHIGISVNDEAEMVPRQLIMGRSLLAWQALDVLEISTLHPSLSTVDSLSIMRGVDRRTRARWCPRSSRSTGTGGDRGPVGPEGPQGQAGPDGAVVQRVQKVLLDRWDPQAHRTRRARTNRCCWAAGEQGPVEGGSRGSDGHVVQMGKMNGDRWAAGPTR